MQLLMKTPNYPSKLSTNTTNQSHTPSVINQNPSPNSANPPHPKILLLLTPKSPPQHSNSMDQKDRLEAQRLLEIAHKLLVASDLVGSKCFAEQALESDPLLDGIDQILAISDVLLASQRRVNNQPDWYSILQLPHPSDSPLHIKRSYRHLSLLLSPARNKLLYADAALRNVSDAFSFLSDPAKKSLYDSQLRSDVPPVAVAQPTVRSFWTACPSCCHVFEYDRVYVGRQLRCRVCMHAFHAGEMPKAPHIVPGTDMYYCAWGFFPLGFPGSGFPDRDSAGWKMFNPVSPRCGSEKEGIKETETETPLNAVPVNAAVGTPNVNKRSLPMRSKKVVAKKRVGNYYEKKRDLFGEDSEVEGVVEVGGGRVGAVGTNEGGEGIASFEIDLEATEDLLSNLHDLPFV